MRTIEVEFEAGDTATRQGLEGLALEDIDFYEPQFISGDHALIVALIPLATVAFQAFSAIISTRLRQGAKVVLRDKGIEVSAATAADATKLLDYLKKNY